MKVNLEGKVAVVTGGVRNIGRAIAVGLAGSGAHVAVTYSTDKAAADDTTASLREHGVQAAAYQTDVRPLCAKVRVGLGASADPIAELRASGYVERMARDRSQAPARAGRATAPAGRGVSE